MTSPPPSSPSSSSMSSELEAKFKDVKVKKPLLNSLVMDYLISEGYPSSAENFAQEANIQPRMDMDSIQERVEIRNAIYRGDIQTAIFKINELNPQILDTSPPLHFSLLRLHLIELIRNLQSTTPPTNDISPALDFATTHLAPRAPSDPQFLSDLELTMSLLIFAPSNLAPQLQALLDPGLRKEVARNVNEALLRGEGERTKCRLLELVRARAWAEAKVKEEGRIRPGDLFTFGLEVGGEGPRRVFEGLE
ncbi:hypothetical protein MMC25_006259 [Agyrium rufum]|nr:hypothetical protein [Agyrium rufum]